MARSLPTPAVRRGFVRQYGGLNNMIHQCLHKK